jgi:AraC-like DNA-binding protein
MHDDDSSGVVRASFASSDVDEVEQFFGAAYTDLSISLSPDRRRFGFRHDTVAAAAFSINRMSSALTFAALVPSMGGKIIVDHMVSGGLTFTSNRYGETGTPGGGTLLGPTDEDFRLRIDECDVEIVTLDTGEVADYAAETCGIEPNQLDFTDIAPISDGHHHRWQRAVAHVRDDVLGSPLASTSPIVVENAFRTLAATLLSTFSNTALEAATDPDGPGVRGDVSRAVLREVIDYLDTHSDRPVGPGDISALAGIPAREIVEGLRRHRDTHPAQVLWASRMRGVHRDLVDADPEHESVRAIATRWGFGHLGRFEIAYMQAFDETPETTLHR